MTTQSPSGQDSKLAFTALFVRRPILAAVLNTLLVVAGLAALVGVEVRELPDVDRPSISVRTTYEGAAPETIDQEVTQTIEGAVARVSGVKSISSNSQFGTSRVTMEFGDNVDMAVAANDVRDAIGRVTNQLPDDADEPQIIKADSDSQPIMRLAVTSSTLSMEDLTKLVDDEVIDRLAAVDGVADVELYGDQEKVFRVDLNQAALASRGLTVTDISTALASAALDVPAGSLKSSTQDIVVRATASLTKPEDFSNLLIKDNIRLRDVATVMLGADDESTSLRSNGVQGVGLGVIRQAQSNTLNISTGVKAAVEAMSANLPQGTRIVVTSDDAVFIEGALHEVELALGLSALIVVVVLYLFLRDWRATLIPAITMPVALIGTIIAIYMVGFSINILTLLAIVLATGLVVDDAIVVLENIVRRRAEGMGPRAAAVLGTQEVFFAVIATTATLAAVFIPLSFLPGQLGGLFREFGFVLAFAVGLSSIVALTLCPMLASRMLKDGLKEPTGPLAWFGNVFASTYKKTLSACLNNPLIVIIVALVFSGLSWIAFGMIQNELTPREDRASVMMRVTAPQGVSLDYTRDQLQRIEENLQPLRDSGEIRNIYSITGMNGSSNTGFLVLTLAPWADRDRTQNQIAADVTAAANKVPALRGNAMQPNSLRIRGAGNGLQMAMVGSNYQALTAATQKLLLSMEESGLFETPRLDNEPNQAQLSVSIDRERASDLGIDITGLSRAMQSLLEGRSVVDVFVDGDAIPVRLLSSTRPINDPTDLENVFLKTGDGKIVPMSVIATLKENAVAPQLNREQQLPSVGFTANLKDGVSLGQALEKVNELSQSLLPPGARLLPLGEAATLEENSSGMLLTFGFAIAIIFLVLAAQFESVLSSIIIMSTVPLGLACAVIALLVTGSSLNVYSQIGLVLLVGVMAKNGILIVEFANHLRDQGATVREAIEKATSIRLRPVMMTMIATILGGVPLVLAQGAGAEARIALGWVIVGGLGFATLVTLYITPVSYLLIARFAKPQADEEIRLHRELELAARRKALEEDKQLLAAE
ncbi:MULTISPECIES: efflux RND transporter permease subunit [Rhizobium/Agrobacterium group]|jgi:HAE1 family hydrophobic/amphiphilic exporter-1|uniref:Efflux RND transporter permease subunit n=1 Tax=Agrobacterium tumefaciens TaxID=358 RepID=A0AA44J9W2_AGRTU|nr:MULTISPECIES: efflux RND transporter permease subunit [Rhizobium/Agrobacterium group]EHJ98514.1 acriflavin resistance protein [Agrobacterium tumefaciens 5A]QDG91101.1 efflux RND transporter permease subunit [Rhizobium sp. NIBRBAC000502774]MDP9762429.1 HAE1 family hydrophobic/amphiphilic exporter-1 [Agrobacterium tumefaciens]MDQ1223025.1 HAE1 family hydrophobic/amphiphilic exporter-1 [Agrobacterium sp. SORGH_AS_0745]NSL24697.1 efflux RND transporter permease subunit [Agrobacterium tumefacien